VFAGIGSGVVALKRVGISMKKIIHVEHDHVANHGKYAMLSKIMKSLINK
jgi:hypothetical protein